MTDTIYTQEPGKYHVWKTVGGWKVVFIVDRHNFRDVDGGTLHANRQNAYAKAKRLNDRLKRIMQKTGMAEAYFDGYTAGVNEEQEGYRLYIQKEGMPPHFSKEFATLAEVEQEMRDSFFPQPINWYKVKPEEI
jgi:hypothetical protein